MTSPLRDVGRTLRTVAHLRPAQVASRLRVQARRRLVDRRPEAFAERWRVDSTGAVGLPAAFRALDATHLAARWEPDEIARGSFDLLHHRRDLGGPDATVVWDQPDATQLWRFHLHYWEWAWSLAAAPDRAAARATFARLWHSWDRASPFGRWDAWAPYPASLRAWVLVNVHGPLTDGTDLAGPLTDSIARHAGFLEHNVELDVGGNHLVKNIKGILGCAVFLGHQRLVDLALQHLDRELETQVLADGGHYELSPSYHCQVLTDFIDMSRLLEASGRPPVPALEHAIAAMRRWLGVMVMPDGDVPLFNDCEPVAPDLLAALEPGPGAAPGLTVLPHSGYVVVRRGPFHLVADVGQPGPASPPGHIHADCLTFELAVDGRRAVVDSGTSEYGSGPRREHERSTAAHNTVEVDGTDQTEVWGAFRAGRRARATFELAEETDDAIRVIASHDGYRHLPGSPLHRRTWTITDRTVSTHDRISGTGEHRVVARFLLPAEVLEDEPAGVDGDLIPVPPQLVDVVLDGPHLTAPRPTSASRADTGPSWAISTRAHGFGTLLGAVQVSVDQVTDLPVTIDTTLTA